MQDLVPTACQLHRHSDSSDITASAQQHLEDGYYGGQQTIVRDRPEIFRNNVTRHPTAEWTAQQLLQAFPFDTAPRYLLRDRDRIYGQEFRSQVAVMDIKEVLSAPRSPWQRAYVERVIGSIRRECLDHVIVLNEESLRRNVAFVLLLLSSLASSSLVRARLTGIKTRTNCGSDRCFFRSRRLAPSLRTRRVIDFQIPRRNARSLSVFRLKLELHQDHGFDDLRSVSSAP